MLRLIIFLPLATALKQSLGRQGEDKFGISNDVPKKLQQEIVDKHNAIRSNVIPTASNMLKMRWSEKASQSAKRWASKCPTTFSPEAERTVDGIVCGGNVMHSSYVSSWTDAVELWHSKVSNFKYGFGALDIRKDIYSYTELISYNSYLVGCAVAYCPQKTYPYLYVCYYCPTGNQMDEVARPYKEGPPCGDCPFQCEDNLCTNPCKYTDKKKYCKKLLSLFMCKNKLIEQECQATCRCLTEIV